MVIAIIFGAHLLPYGWLYKSKSYVIFAIIIPFLALTIGCIFEIYLLAAVMVAVELIFSSCLIIESKKLH